MLKSKKGLCSSSSKNPLWVAAFFFKQLKKAQILDSDISSSVDQILRHEMDAVSYRVLGYLLSGVVKIYSKQVEYLLDDCNKVLFGINKFVIKTKSNTPVEKLRMSFIMPDSFDLDAIDLGTLEDTSGFHTAPPEQITLKDVLSNTAGFMQFSQERFDDFGLGETSCSLDHLMAENVHETQLLNFDFEAFPSSSSTNLLASKDILQSRISGQNVDEFHEESRISQEESTDISMFLGRQKEAVLPSASFNESRQIGIEHNMAMESLRSLCQMDQENVNIDETLAFRISSQNVDEFHEESRISREESIDMSMFLGTQKEAVLPSASFNESRQIGIEHNMAMESLRSLCQVDQENVGFDGPLAFQENENFHHNQSSVVKESVRELIEESIVDPTPQSKFQGNLEVQKRVSFEHGQSIVNPAESTIVDPTPQSKFQGNLEVQKRVSFERGQSIVNPAESTIVDPTPQSKFQGNLEVQKRVSFEHGQSIVNPAESTIVDPTPQSKFQGNLEVQKRVSFEHGQSIVNPAESTIVDPTPQSKFQGNLEVQKRVSFERGQSIVNPAESTIVDPTPQSKFQGNLEVQKRVSFEHGQSIVNPAESTIVDPTPQSKFQGSSIGRPKQGSTSTTSEFKLIPTPTATESARFSKKRKFVIDKTMVLPTEVLKRSILDASDLVSVHRPLRLSLLDKQRKYQHSSLLNRFNESLFTCHSAKLKSLFSSKKMKIPNSLKIKKNLPESDVSESRAVRIPDHIEIPPRFSETIRELDVSQSQTCGSSDHIAAAPETPPLCPNVKVRTAKQHDIAETPNSDDFGPSSPHEREQSLERNADMVEEFNAETSNTYETMDDEQSFTMDEDLNLMNEEMNSPETENSKMSGWSDRTRKVASYLSKTFQDPGKQNEAGSVNLSQVSQGRTRKESARLFYEILVLKTTNYVDVQQNKAYGDIAVKKLPKLDKTFGV